MTPVLFLDVQHCFCSKHGYFSADKSKCTIYLTETNKMAIIVDRWPL